MVTWKHSEILRTIPVLIVVCLFAFPAQAKYSGGTGEPNDPYQIATAEDLIALGETPTDYDKHFVLVADIDLDPNLPGRKVFDKAVIGPIGAAPFTGVFDGNGRTISNLTITGGSNLGLFGQLASWDAPSCEVKNLGLVDVNMTGSGNHVGALAGSILAWNLAWGTKGGSVTHCYSTGAVGGTDGVGGLVGVNEGGTVTQCHSTGSVIGTSSVGGLVGCNYRDVTQCYSTGAVSGTDGVGGLVGSNYHDVTQCYSTGGVTGTSNVGGLVGAAVAGVVIASFWDMESSGQATSAGGIGRTTAEMQTAGTFLGWGACGPLWTIDEGRDYPHLAWENVPGQVITGPTYAGGMGTPEDPYLIYRPEELNLIGLAPCDWDKHFRLMADIDLSGFDGKDGRPPFNVIGLFGSNYDTGSAGIPFTGVFDGNGHRISHLTITGRSNLGLFGCLKAGAEVKDLGVVDVNIAGSGAYVGALAGDNGGTLTNCYSTGTVIGWGHADGAGVGGLVGANRGNVTQCYSTGAVSGKDYVGGLVGQNGGSVTQCHSTGVVTSTGYCVGGLVGANHGILTHCYSTGAVSGLNEVGGLVGSNIVCDPGICIGTLTQCYSAGAVSGNEFVGGLVGANDGILTHCYSTGTVSGLNEVGGLVGNKAGGDVTGCFWDTQTSGQATSAAGTGKTTPEMQTPSTFLKAGWDFMGETANGTEDVWWILEGKDYPRLWWEATNN